MSATLDFTISIEHAQQVDLLVLQSVDLSHNCTSTSMFPVHIHTMPYHSPCTIDLYVQSAGYGIMERLNEGHL